MKNNIIILISFFLLFFTKVNAQDKRGYNVVYGGNAVMAIFDGTINKPNTRQYIPIPISPSNNIYVGGAHSCISDSGSGNLLMLCNGYILYDTLGNIIENGDTLVNTNLYNANCCPSAGIFTQGSLILPKGGTNQFYVFTVSVTDTMYTYWNTNPLGDGRFPFDILQYHVVDMNANGGMGKVIQKNVKILENKEISMVGMMACKHANGYDWWLLKQGANTNTIYTFLVTKDTVVLDTIQAFPQPVFGYYAAAGQSCFNSDGSKYAFSTGGVNSNGTKLFMADFDRCHGVLSNIKVIEVPLHITNSYLDTLYPGEKDTLIRGLCFSPNDSFLYISKSYNVYQYEWNKLDSNQAWSHIKQGPDTTFLQFAEYGQLHLGIDGRIYIGKRGGTGNSNSVIDKPNIKGTGCDFCRKCLRCDTCDYTHSFANMPNFNTPKKEPCWPLNSSVIGDVSNEMLEVYPNPANSTLYIKCDKRIANSQKELYNTIGQLMLITKENEIDVSGLSKGMYYLRVESQVVKVVIE